MQANQSKRQGRSFWVVWSKGTQHVAPCWRVYSDRDADRLRYIKDERWRVLGFYSVEDGVPMLEQDLTDWLSKYAQVAADAAGN